MRGFQVYGDGQWRVMPHGGGLLGGATRIDLNTILCASRYKGMFSISTVDGSVKDVNWTLPDKDCCVFLHSTPSGRVLAITAEPVMPSQLTRNDSGAFGKLLVFENGQAKVLLDGFDFDEGWFDKGRPVVDAPEGTFIATSGGGIVFVSADSSQVKRLDWRFGIPTPNVDRIRIQGDLLYLLDRSKGLAIVDWQKLLRQAESPEKDRWDVRLASLDPVTAVDGSVWWLDTTMLPGQLCCWREGKLTHIPLKDASRGSSPIPAASATSMARHG